MVLYILLVNFVTYLLGYLEVRQHCNSIEETARYENKAQNNEFIQKVLLINPFKMWQSSNIWEQH